MKHLPLSLVVQCKYIGPTKTKNSRIRITAYHLDGNKIVMERSFQSCLDFSGNDEINVAYDYASVVGKMEWDKTHSEMGFQFSDFNSLKAELDENTFIYLFPRIV